MENFDDFENKSYKESKKVEYGFADYAAYLLKMFFFGIQILGLTLKEYFINIFFPQNKKDFTGQLALITGEISQEISK